MLLNLCTWQEVERYLAGSTGIIVPIGSTEQHGPTGLIGTDTICADVIARGVGEATDAMVAPTIAVGMAEHHMAFAGTVTYRPSTLVQVVCDHVLSLARHFSSTATAATSPPSTPPFTRRTPPPAIARSLPPPKFAAGSSTGG